MCANVSQQHEHSALEALAIASAVAAAATAAAAQSSTHPRARLHHHNTDLARREVPVVQAASVTVDINVLHQLPHKVVPARL